MFVMPTTKLIVFLHLAMCHACVYILICPMFPTYTHKLNITGIPNNYYYPLPYEPLQGLTILQSLYTLNFT
jgi:hypothetical protein